MLTLLVPNWKFRFLKNICINLYFANVCQLSEIKVRYLKSNLFWTITLYVGKWIQVSSFQFQKFIVKRLHVRVDMVGTNHNKVLTLWRHMPMGQFCANIFLIQLTSTYFWASEVFKNQSFKSQLFSSSQKKYLKLKSWLNFNAIIVFY